MSHEPPDPDLPAKLREFHERLPLAGDPPNAVLSLPDDRLLYLVAILRDTPVPAPALSPEEWRAFRDALTLHGVFLLLAYRLRSWPVASTLRHLIPSLTLVLTCPRDGVTRPKRQFLESDTRGRLFST